MIAGKRPGFWGVWGVVVFLMALAGCQEASVPRGGDGRGAFRVSQVHIEPSFTVIKGADVAKNQPARVEAYVRLRDQYGDPIKGVGQFRFEFFEYRAAFADVRGRRFTNGGVQTVDLRSVEANQGHWDGITQSYRIPVVLPAEATVGRQIVLQVTFTQEPDYRLRDVQVLSRDGAP